MAGRKRRPSHPTDGSKRAHEKPAPDELALYVPTKSRLSERRALRHRVDRELRRLERIREILTDPHTGRPRSASVAYLQLSYGLAAMKRARAQRDATRAFDGAVAGMIEAYLGIAGFIAPRGSADLDQPPRPSADIARLVPREDREELEALISQRNASSGSTGGRAKRSYIEQRRAQVKQLATGFHRALRSDRLLDALMRESALTTNPSLARKGSQVTRRRIRQDLHSLGLW